ncbi:MAG: acyl carrier protein [Kiritimatiellae bacterium]|nr:acyl carrier protein [Kiritimatiellia bacterium]
MALEDKVVDLIVEKLGVNKDQVTPEASLIEDLGADSLDTVELVMAFEETFGKSIPDEDAEKLKKVGDIIAYLKEQGQE